MSDIHVMPALSNDSTMVSKSRYYAQLEKLSIPQFLRVLDCLNQDTRATDLTVVQSCFVYLPKVRRACDAVLLGRLIDLNPKPKKDMIEAHVCLLVDPCSGDAHGEQGTLRHSRDRKESQLALRAGTDGPCAERVLLLKEVASGFPVQICKGRCSSANYHYLPR